MYADDTIAAIATAAGPGGVGIVRASGPHCARIAHTVFLRRHSPAGHGSQEWLSHHLYYGDVVDAAGVALDTGLAVFMRGPRSYTGEDVLELHCHGSPVALRRVLARVLGCGARPAEKGEFTKRAFLNGRIDLAQAEAVIDMVRSRTDAGAALAARQLSGHLSEHLTDLRSRLIQLKALLEAQIDFSEEDFEVDSSQLSATLADCTSAVNRLLDTYRHGKLIRDGLRVAIIGKPNVGKSSLLNALLGEARAIVTPVAGTTRDSIDETADFDGLPVVLSDTAGLRSPDQADLVERLGMQRTTAKIAAADVVLTVLDASQSVDSDDRSVLEAAHGLPQIIVLNKIDLGPAVGVGSAGPSAEGFGPLAGPLAVGSLCAAVSDKLLGPAVGVGSAGPSAEGFGPQAGPLANGHSVVRVSAKERIGLGDLRRAVVNEVTGRSTPDSDVPVLTNLRHHEALTKAVESLKLVGLSLSEGRPADLVAVDVQDAIDHIGTVTGSITTEEVLDRVFAEFCIGK